MDGTPLPTSGTILSMYGNLGWHLCFAYKPAGAMYTPPPPYFYFKKIALER